MRQRRHIYIVDGDFSHRAALASTLSAAGLLPQLFGTGEDFLDALGHLDAGCLILDVHLPGIDGFEVQKRVAADRPDLPQMMMACPADIPMAVRAIKGGALDFFQKPLVGALLIDMLDHAFLTLDERGERMGRRQIALNKIGELTARERELLCAMLEGGSNRLMARELGIGIRTVEMHRANAMRKLDAHNLADVVQIALDAGFLPMRAAA